jgi:hypothetical protein
MKSARICFNQRYIDGRWGGSVLEDTELTPVTIPGQHVPTHDNLPGGWQPPLPPKKERHGGLVAAIVGIVVAVVVIVAPIPGDTHGEFRGFGSSTAEAAKSPPPPYELAEDMLNKQAAALLRGDQAGWLAAVDPAQPTLRKKYLNMYNTLRSLKVTKFTYDLDPAVEVHDEITADAAVDYCLFRSAKACTDAPWFGQKLTLKQTAKGWLITRLAADKSSPQTPWQNGDLVFKEGKRVVVGAPASLRGRLDEVVSVADQAATVDDKIAKKMQNPQEKYRIFLADDKSWSSWYGGRFPSYSVAYTIPLGESGSDVVLHMSDFDGRHQLQITVQHEMAHVATLSNVGHNEDDDDLWLMEGVAEYAGWLPLHAGRDLEMPILHEAFQGKSRPKTIAAPPLKSTATGDQVDIFYGLGHYSVDCMVTKYGESRTMDFVRLKLREGKSLDSASRTALGKPFSTVDKSCLSWVADHSG